MNRMPSRVPLLLAVLAMAMPAQAEELPKDCPAAPFVEARIARVPGDWASAALVQAESKADARTPPEMARIRTGVVSHSEGGYINDGSISWTGYDAERAVFVSVIGGAGPRLESAPGAERLQSNQLFRYTTAAGYRRSELVTVVSANPAQHRAMLCALNALAADPSVQGLPRMKPTDMLAKDLTVWLDGRSMVSGDSPRRPRLEWDAESIMSEALGPTLLKTYRR